MLKKGLQTSQQAIVSTHGLLPVAAPLHTGNWIFSGQPVYRPPVRINERGPHLLNRALSLEEDASPQQFCEDAADGPNVDGRAVVAAAHQHLRRPVVLRHHLLGHVARRVGLLHARQAKITNLAPTHGTALWSFPKPASCRRSAGRRTYFEQAVAVDQQVSRFDVPVQNASRVQVLQA